jgi:hypothetical protein
MITPVHGGIIIGNRITINSNSGNSMKWKVTAPKQGRIRIRRSFAWLPHRLLKQDTVVWLQSYWAIDRWQMGDWDPVTGREDGFFYASGSRWEPLSESEYPIILTDTDLANPAEWITK